VDKRTGRRRPVSLTGVEFYGRYRPGCAGGTPTLSFSSGFAPRTTTETPGSSFPKTGRPECQRAFSCSFRETVCTRISTTTNNRHSTAPTQNNFLVPCGRGVRRNPAAKRTGKGVHQRTRCQLSIRGERFEYPDHLDLTLGNCQQRLSQLV